MKKTRKYARCLIRLFPMLLTALVIWHGETEGIYAKCGMAFVERSACSIKKGWESRIRHMLSKEREGISVKEREGVSVKEGECIFVKEGEGVSVKEGECIFVKEGECISVKEGEGVSVKEGEGISVKKGEGVFSVKSCVISKSYPVRRGRFREDISGEGENRSSVNVYQGENIEIYFEKDRYDEIIYIRFCKEWRDCRNEKRPITVVTIIGR